MSLFEMPKEDLKKMGLTQDEFDALWDETQTKVFDACDELRKKLHPLMKDKDDLCVTLGPMLTGGNGARSRCYISIDFERF